MDPTLILIAVALAVFVFFQFRTSRKRAKETAARQAAIAPGVEIMTNYGLYGTILSIDEDTNMALIETTPGTVLKIHRQTILKAVEDETPEASESDAAADSVQLNEDSAIVMGDPEFGERVEPEATEPARKAAPKKSDD
ncbi:preprotein translocase subunit YajC [Glaciihabitans sp. INWT7]|uniref:preprotein translocase subunit YajC n=1 Tax=Glaciihabitans sp. INWT7 TaxID=2596912 RepID=UPI00162A686D|nr:preprotein translocase subunit YajC [Glaciihabitans sp. INWT7]QNE46904.1 preprotein translocase subunit YajC [Glaciihabitans sp. INWT7]